MKWVVFMWGDVTVLGFDGYLWNLYHNYPVWDSIWNFIASFIPFLDGATATKNQMPKWSYFDSRYPTHTFFFLIMIGIFFRCWAR